MAIAPLTPQYNIPFTLGQLPKAKGVSLSMIYFKVNVFNEL
jgi:hypothetical protein